jgi:hypothetical protein
MDYILEPCLDCVRKHLAQAKAKMLEYQKASDEFPFHFDDALGHLAEAEDESVGKYPELAKAIREERVKTLQEDNYWPNFKTLQLYAIQLSEEENSEKSENPENA